MYKEQTLIAASAALLVFLIFSYSLEIIAYDKSFYNEQYEKNGIYKRFGKENVDKTTNELLTYLRYEKGETLMTTSFFNQKEKQHLLDVKNLLQKESRFCTWMTGVFLAMLFLLFPAARGGQHPYRKVLLCAGAVGLGGILVLGLFLLLNFSTAFTTFHLLLFTNDLWMLNPATDNLIVLFPETFWIAMAGRLFLVIGLFYGCLLAAGSFLTAQSH